MIVFAINLVLLGMYFFLIRFYHRSWNRVPAFSIEAIDNFFPSEKISVIVPARNEEKVIELCIQSLLKQSYPKELLEIIIADDYSTDGTAGIVRRHQEQGVQLLSLKDQATGVQPVRTAYKKMAITAAIKQSSGSLVITTDADCIFPEDWVKTVAAFHQYSKAVFIVSPVRMRPDSTVLSVFQSMDFTILQGITAASVYVGFHKMCNGANLAYEKTAFWGVSGFDNIDHIASGDDMLLMEKIADKYPDRIAYLHSKDAIVETRPVATWKDFFNQRIRWASKTRIYKDKRLTWVMALIYLVNLGLFILLAGSIFQLNRLLFFVVGLIIKVLIEWRFVKEVSTYFNLSGWMKWFPVFQPLHIVYTVVAGFLGLIGRYEWKGRRVR